MKNNPIGIFDSGVGGLTVVNKLFHVLPKENIVYFGDTARVPYGNKSKETVTRFSKEIVKFLLKFKVKLIVVACNTASSLSLEALKRSFSVPIIGVIKPGAEKALALSKTKRIGVIGTEATISSSAYAKKIKEIERSAFVAGMACPLFVPLVENGWLNDEITLKIIKVYLAPILEKRIDALILGCTHYPLLKNAIQKITGKKIKLVDSSMAVAEYIKRFLEEKSMLADSARPCARFFASDNTGNFTKLAGIFLRKRITAKKIVL